MNYISQANVGGTTYTVGLPNVYVNNKGNLNIETSTEIGNTPADKGKINIEANSDIQLKPGDDIVLYSHHRAEGKTDEVAVKVTDGDDVPVKLQLNAAEITLTTKDKTGDNAEVLDVNVNSGKNTKGYLKVRAHAIDLRCEDHGGIALQPKGKDSQDHENKIKFEHGGGDGLEFGTFNTEKTSIFTDEYRFNKDGVWKMATRVKEASDKADADDATTAYKYQKQTDDFYDVIDNSDAVATTKDIIKTASALNHNANIETHITQNGNLEIASTNKWKIYEFQAVTEETPGYQDPLFSDFGTEGTIDFTKYHTFDEIANYLFADYSSSDKKAMSAILKSHLISGTNAVSYNLWVTSQQTGPSEGYYTIEPISYVTPSINIESDANISIKSENELELKGILDFGSTFNFGETDKGIETLYKRTAGNKTKDCGILKVVAFNNSSSAYTFNTIWDPTANDNAGANQSETTTSVAAGESQVIAQCSIYDIIKLVNYMKDNNEGPWASQQ